MNHWLMTESRQLSLLVICPSLRPESGLQEVYLPQSMSLSNPTLYTFLPDPEESFCDKAHAPGYPLTSMGTV